MNTPEEKKEERFNFKLDKKAGEKMALDLILNGQFPEKKEKADHKEYI